MDRFIGFTNYDLMNDINCLKSNMDRFIVELFNDKFFNICV